MFANENEFRKAVEGADINDAPRPKHQEELRKRVLMPFLWWFLTTTSPRKKVCMRILKQWRNALIFQTFSTMCPRARLLNCPLRP